MGYVNKVYQKAVMLIRTRNIDQNEFMSCLEAGICPTCGEPLKVVEISGERYVICKKECLLISPNGVDYKILGHDVWKRCIDNTIRKVALVA